MADTVRVSTAVRRFVFERANGCCEYCGSQVRFATGPFVVEHINPRSLGGLTTLDNLAFSCAGCNGHKSVKTQALDPVSAQVVQLFNPRRDQWAEHFRWTLDDVNVVGITACGRATIDALNLNRRSLVNLRRVLVLAGEHPPNR